MKLHPKARQAYQLMHKGTIAFAKAEMQGMRIDTDYINNQKRKLTKKIKRKIIKFKNTKFYKDWRKSTKGAVNLNSNPQLSEYLYNYLKIEPIKFTKKNKPSTDEEALLGLNIPELNILLDIRKYQKAKDTYLDGFLTEETDGFIHPFFNLHLTVTYRSSSDSPNFQNIPKRDKEIMKIIRSSLFPRKGHQLLEVDYKAIEVAVAACYNEDPNLLKYVRDPKSDMHGDMAQQIFKIKKFNKHKDSHNTLRQASKNGFVFPQFYGDYYVRCAENISEWIKLPNKGIWKASKGIELEEGINISDHLRKKGIKKFEHFVEHLKNIENDFWGNRFEKYKWWKDTMWETYNRYGSIDLKTGFMCKGVMKKNNVNNYPIQGSAFHCLLWSFVEIDKELEKRKLQTKLIGQIHDAIVFDVYPPELKEVTTLVKEITCIKLPQAWDWIIVPLTVEMELCPVDASWAEKEDYVC